MLAQWYKAMAAMLLLTSELQPQLRPARVTKFSRDQEGQDRFAG